MNWVEYLDLLVLGLRTLILEDNSKHSHSMMEDLQVLVQQTAKLKVVI